LFRNVSSTKCKASAFVRQTYRRPLFAGKDGGPLETNRIDVASPGQQQQQQQQQKQKHRPSPQRPKSEDVEDNAAASATAAVQASGGGGGGGPAVTVDVNARATASSADGAADGGNTALTSPKRREDDDPQELQVSTHGAFFFALGCGFALIVALVAVFSALAYKRSGKSPTRSKSKESLQ